MSFNLFVGGLFLSSFAFAETPAVPSASTVVVDVEKHYDALSGFQANFVQTVASELYGDTVQTGSVQFEKPGKMRWVFAEDGKEYVADGDQMWVYVPADKQVFHYPNFDASGSAQSLLHSLGNLDALYTVTVLSTSASKVALELSPKLDASFSKVTLELAANFDIQSVELRDNLGTKTQLVFSDLVNNPKLDAKRFLFEAPEGVMSVQVGAP